MLTGILSKNKQASQEQGQEPARHRSSSGRRPVATPDPLSRTAVVRAGIRNYSLVPFI